MHAREEARWRLLRRRENRAEPIQVHRAAGEQGPEAGALPPRRERRRQRKERRLHDHGRRLLAAALAGAALLASAASAQAAQRYAAPAGTGETCSQQAPCSLVTAIGKASSNDEVIVTA